MIWVPEILYSQHASKVRLTFTINNIFLILNFDHRDPRKFLFKKWSRPQFFFFNEKTLICLTNPDENVSLMIFIKLYQKSQQWCKINYFFFMGLQNICV